MVFANGFMIKHALRYDSYDHLHLLVQLNMLLDGPLIKKLLSSVIKRGMEKIMDISTANGSF